MSSHELTNSGRDTGAKGTIHRKCDACEEDKEQTIQRIAFPADRDAPTLVDAHVGEALAMAGHQLERSTRDFFEPRFGYDFSSIRIHTGPTARTVCVRGCGEGLHSRQRHRLWRRRVFAYK
jgi:hypothetical protein